MLLERGVVALAVLSRTGLDIARHIAIALPPEQVGVAQEIVGSDARTVDQRLAAPHRGQRLLFLLVPGVARQVKAGQGEASHDLMLERRTFIPKQADKRVDVVPPRRVPEQIHGRSVRTLDQVVEHGGGYFMAHLHGGPHELAFGRIQAL